jgi:hypothetical protein
LRVSERLSFVGSNSHNFLSQRRDVRARELLQEGTRVNASPGRYLATLQNILTALHADDRERLETCPEGKLLDVDWTWPILLSRKRNLPGHGHPTLLFRLEVHSYDFSIAHPALSNSSPRRPNFLPSAPLPASGGKKISMRCPCLPASLSAGIANCGLLTSGSAVLWSSGTTKTLAGTAN